MGAGAPPRARPPTRPPPPALAGTGAPLPVCGGTRVRVSRVCQHVREVGVLLITGDYQRCRRGSGSVGRRVQLVRPGVIDALAIASARLLGLAPIGNVHTY